MANETLGTTEEIPGKSAPIAKSKKAIFLSHEGLNKMFANNLYDELQNRNLTTFFDQDRESLPLGERFPDKIIEGLRDCELVAFVISKSFVTKKWPMIELVQAYLHFKKNKKPLLLPLFYNLDVNEIDETKQPTTWNSWSEEWHKMESTFTTSSHDKIMINAKLCAEALKHITKHNGMSKGTLSDSNFKKNVVDEICRLVKPDIWGINDMQHHEELSEDVKRHFGEIAEGPKLLGMWGDKNSGKSKLSNALCFHYFSEYEGTVQCMELKEGSKSIMKEMRNILQTLTSANWSVVDAITSLDHAINYFKERISGKRLFLAIDNIPDDEGCKKGLRDLWEAIKSCTRDSKVLLTARDRKVLESFLRECGCAATQAIQVPQVEEQGAIDILVGYATNFKKTWDTYGAENQKAAIKRLCRSPPIKSSSGRFSPGEAKSVGLLIRGSEMVIAEDPLRWQSVVEEYRSSDLHLLFSQSIQRTLERAFDDNAQVQQALLFITDAALYESAMGHTLQGIYRWLGIVHGITRKTVKKKFEEFRRYELIDWSPDEEKRDEESPDVRMVFDWPGFTFPKFAKAEARNNPSKWKWFYYDGEHPEVVPKKVEQVERIEKMALVGGVFNDVAEVVSVRQCVGVVAFMMARCSNVQRLQVRFMKELQLLEIEDCPELQKIKRLQEAKELERLYLNWVPNWPVPANTVLDLSRFRYLQSVRLINTGMEYPPFIRGCPDLRELYIEGNTKLKELPLLSRDLTSLTNISFADNPQITFLPDLSPLAASLSSLSIRNCASLTNIKTIEYLTSLECLNCSCCQKLDMPLPDLSKLPSWQSNSIRLSAKYLHPNTVQLWSQLILKKGQYYRTRTRQGGNYQV